MPLPTRMRVLPSSTAARQSAVIPIERVSTSGWRRFRASKASRMRAKARRPPSAPFASGIAIRPRRRSFGSSAIRSASASISSQETPDFVASPSAFTSIKTLRGARFSGRCAERRSAIFTRSIVCTQSKVSATGRVLFDCSDPMKCHSTLASGWRSRKSRHFSTPSCT